ncbi:MAG: hypothetical protein LAO79_06955 [Acidobacteriia bacterium]|nr:hypothetical protein [Terriglobia bacterium]
MALVAMAGANFASSFAVNAGGTYLELAAEDTCSWFAASGQCTGPAFFDPTVIAVTPGSTIQLFALGSINYGTMTAAPLFGALFSTDGNLGASTSLNRVTGAVAAGSPNPYVVTTTNSYFAGNNDISQDFQVGTSVVTVVVPNNANFLFVGVLDSFYADNSGNASITLNELATPEPATYALALAGLAALLFVRKLRA